MPMANVSFIRYEIYMLFEYNDVEGAKVNVWFQGKVVSIVNENIDLAYWQWSANIKIKLD